MTKIVHDVILLFMHYTCYFWCLYWCDVKMLLIIIWFCYVWCWYDMNYLYTAESYLRWKCRSKSRSYRMFMKFLRRKMLSPCILIQSWGLDALELLLNYVGGLMPWSFCSTTTMELLLNHDDGAFAQPETRAHALGAFAQ
jgi:hypothetical protein